MFLKCPNAIDSRLDILRDWLKTFDLFALEHFKFGASSEKKNKPNICLAYFK